MQIPLSEVTAIIRDITVTGGLIYILWGGKHKVWVWGYQLLDCVSLYERLLKESNAREMAIWDRYNRLLDTTEKAVKTIPVPKGQDV